MSKQTLLLVQSFPGTALQVLQHLGRRISFVYFEVGSILHRNVNVLFFFFCKMCKFNKTVTALCLLTGRKESLSLKSIFVFYDVYCHSKWFTICSALCNYGADVTVCAAPFPSLWFSFITLTFYVLHPFSGELVSESFLGKRPQTISILLWSISRLLAFPKKNHSVVSSFIHFHAIWFIWLINRLFEWWIIHSSLILPMVC